MADPPDLVVFLTDEERAPPHYESPDLQRWRSQALTARTWFRKHGISFERHYTGATACVPSRPTLLTGHYPDLHGVTQTDGLGKRSSEPRMRWLKPDETPTIGHWLRPLGYDTVYIGKWHASHADLHDADGNTIATNTGGGKVLPEGVRAYEEAQALEPFGFSGWVGPEPHGAAFANSGLVRDRIYADQALRFLSEREQARARGDGAALRPFLLFVSFVNPHDIVLWPRWARRNPLRSDPQHPPPVPEAPTQYEDLRSKPATQSAYRDAYYHGYGVAPAVKRSYTAGAARYRRTYMRLHLEVDRQIERVRSALMESSRADNTVMLLSSDHGDMLGAHGGLHQKWMNLYDECVRVPLLVAHTGGFGPQDVRCTEQLTSHVDLLPTLIALAGGDEGELSKGLRRSHSEVHPLPGRDLTGLIAAKTAPDAERCVYIMSRDNILEGDDGLSIVGRVVGARMPVGPFAGSPPAYVGSNLEALVTPVADDVWKIVRTYDDPRTWTEPGQRQLVGRSPAGKQYRDQPLPDEWELYNLDADPSEGHNRAADPACTELMAELQRRLESERGRLIPERNTPRPYAPADGAPDGMPITPRPIAVAARRLLARFGLHRVPPAPSMDSGGLTSRRALVITTSHRELSLGQATGVFASEMTVPYYAFVDAGLQVDVASVEGGVIPVDPVSLRPVVRTAEDDRYLGDPVLQDRVRHSLSLAELDMNDYDAVFLAGGWGAAFDLGTSSVVADRVSEAVAHGAVLGGICHGPLGLLQAVNPDGTPFVRGRRLTAVTDKQVRELGITSTPQHPERELRAAGAHFESSHAMRDIFANHVVCDGDLITGQNQNAGHEVAHHMMQRLLERPQRKPGVAGHV